MSKKKVKKEKPADDWCFVCKDGGCLRICDYKKCNKAYHPECVDRDDSLLESSEKWICNWHRCCACNKTPKYNCFCCPFAVCKGCRSDVEFAIIRKEKGFCEECLELAWLIEEKRDVDSSGSKVDFQERDTVEFLFYEYYEIIKDKEGWTSEQVITGYNNMKRSSDSSDKEEKEPEGFDREREGSDKSDGDSSLEVYYEEFGKRRKKKQLKRKATPKKKLEFIGWASKPLLDFLVSLGKDTSTEMSQYAVTDAILSYCYEHQLFDLVKKRKINFDEKLRTLLRRKSVCRNSLYNLVTPHLAENLASSEDDSGNDSDNIVEVDSVPQKKSRRMSPVEKSIEKSATKTKDVKIEKSCFAAINKKNLMLVYLRRSFVQELAKQFETFEDKVVGCFVKIRPDPHDILQLKNSYMLVQVTGVRTTSGMNEEVVLLVSYTVNEVPVRKLSDDDIYEDECDDLCERVKNGLVPKQTVVDLEKKAKSLHEEMTKHWISRELSLLQRRIDLANEKGWRRDLYEYLDRLQILKKPEEQSRMLSYIPEVIAEDLVLESSSSDGTPEKDD